MMNNKMIGFVLGCVLLFESFFLLLPALVGWIYQEKAGWSFLIAAGINLCVSGLFLILFRPKSRALYSREGLVIVSLSWILLSIFGALPFVISGDIPNFVNALFESVSGFTTTGASIVTDVEVLPKCCIFWRSFMQWIGGMGVLVFIMAFLTLSGARNINIMRAESPGPIVEKFVPRLRSTAFWLYAMYFGLTILEFICLLLAKMSLFDALNTAFATAGTGGFGFRNDSVGSFSTAIQVIVTIFMLLFGINFNMYFLLLHRKFRDACRISEVWGYLLIILVSTSLIVGNIHDMYQTTGEAIKHALFTVASIITTTGFSSTDYNTWPELSRAILMVIIFIGACSGSTSGGIKVSRIIIFFKSMGKEIRLQVHPKQVKKLHINGHELAHETIRTVNAYMVVYLMVFVISVLLISFENHDLVTNFSAVATTLNNTGPGLDLVGPTSNFAFFSSPGKLVLIFDMLAGRLELFPMLLLFSPVTWKK